MSFDDTRLQAAGRLRHDLSYIGALSLTLTIVMEYAFSFIAILLIKFGILSAESLGQPYLGLDNTAFMYVYMAVYALSMAVPALVVSMCFRKRFSPFTPARPVSFGVAFFGILAAIGLCMLANIINSYISYFFTEAGLSVPEAPQTMDATPVSLLLNLFTMAVLPALLEEMIYRGYILRTLRPYGNWYAILVSALLFGLMHGNLRQIPFAFIVGLVLGFLYVSTNNIWIPIAVHFTNNAISVLMEYFAFSLAEEWRDFYYACVIYGLILIGVLCTLILFLGYRKKLRFRGSNTPLSTYQRTKALLTTPLFVASMLMYMLLLVMEI